MRKLCTILLLGTAITAPAIAQDAPPPAPPTPAAAPVPAAPTPPPAPTLKPFQKVQVADPENPGQWNNCTIITVHTGAYDVN